MTYLRHSFTSQNSLNRYPSPCPVLDDDKISIGTGFPREMDVQPTHLVYGHITTYKIVPNKRLFVCFVYSYCLK